MIVSILRSIDSNSVKYTLWVPNFIHWELCRSDCVILLSKFRKKWLITIGILRYFTFPTFKDLENLRKLKFLIPVFSMSCVDERRVNWANTSSQTRFATFVIALLTHFSLQNGAKSLQKSKNGMEIHLKKFCAKTFSEVKLRMFQWNEHAKCVIARVLRHSERACLSK